MAGKKTIEESGAGKWKRRYAGRKRKYGYKATYRLGAAWLSECTDVEDWGCGYCAFKQFLPTSVTYTGLDGSGKFCDRLVDLEETVSVTEGLFMRHVLEHNVNWRTILANALASFTGRMVLVLFVKTVAVDTRINTNDFGDGAIPTIQLCQADLLSMLEPFLHHRETVLEETVFYLEKA